MAWLLSIHLVHFVRYSNTVIQECILTERKLKKKKNLACPSEKQQKLCDTNLASIPNNNNNHTIGLLM